MAELSKDPESTWGATQAYKDAWNEKYGITTPAASASKGEWVDFAVEHGGLDKETAEGMTRDALAEQYSNVTTIAGVSSQPSGGTAYGSPEAGAGADSGTATGTPGTSTSPTTGVKGN